MITGVERLVAQAYKNNKGWVGDYKSLTLTKERVMKKLFLALALLIVFPHGAFAASCDSNTDKWNIGNFCVTTNDTFIPSTSAGQQVVTENYTSANTNNSLSATESGKFITDTGGGPGVGGVGSCSKHILPRAAAGLTYTITAGTECTVTVDTLDSSDLIRYSISGTELDAGDSIKSTGQAGDSVTVTSTVANKWSITNMKGTWTDNSTN